MEVTIPTCVRPGMILQVDHPIPRNRFRPSKLPGSPTKVVGDRRRKEKAFCAPGPGNSAKQDYYRYALFYPRPLRPVQVPSLTHDNFDLECFYYECFYCFGLLDCLRCAAPLAPVHRVGCMGISSPSSFCSFPPLLWALCEETLPAPRGLYVLLPFRGISKKTSKKPQPCTTPVQGSPTKPQKLRQP